MTNLNKLTVIAVLGISTTLGQSYVPSKPPQRGSTSTEHQKRVTQEDEGQPCPQNRDKTAEARIGDYVIRTFRWPDPEGCLQILKKGRVIYSLTSADFKIGGNFENDAGIPIGTDIIGAGVPNLVVGEWSGGAHCCYTLHVFALGENFREVAKIEADDSDGAQFVDAAHNGHYAFKGDDWAFAYWATSFNSSPAPSIFLRYLDGRFRLATDLMSKPEPSRDAFAALVIAVKNDTQWEPTNIAVCGPFRVCGVPVSLWQSMLDLIYSGHSDLAWRLLNETWQQTPKTKRAFATAFCQQLSKSHYWKDLRQWIGSCPGKTHSVDYTSNSLR